MSHKPIFSYDSSKVTGGRTVSKAAMMIRQTEASLLNPEKKGNSPFGGYSSNLKESFVSNRSEISIDSNSLAKFVSHQDLEKHDKVFTKYIQESFSKQINLTLDHLKGQILKEIIDKSLEPIKEEIETIKNNIKQDKENLTANNENSNQIFEKIKDFIENQPAFQAIIPQSHENFKEDILNLQKNHQNIRESILSEINQQFTKAFDLQSQEIQKNLENMKNLSEIQMKDFHSRFLAEKELFFEEKFKKEAGKMLENTEKNQVEINIELKALKEFVFELKSDLGKYSSTKHEKSQNNTEFFSKEMEEKINFITNERLFKLEDKQLEILHNINKLKEDFLNFKNEKQLEILQKQSLFDEKWKNAIEDTNKTIEMEQKEEIFSTIIEKHEKIEIKSKDDFVINERNDVGTLRKKSSGDDFDIGYKSLEIERNSENERIISQLIENNEKIREKDEENIELQKDFDSIGAGFMKEEKKEVLGLSSNKKTSEGEEDDDEIVYNIDDQGFLMDDKGNYILDDNQEMIKLSPEHINYLRDSNILQEEYTK